LIYNPLIMLWFHRRALEAAPTVVDTFERLFPGARSYVDVGAGSGAFAAAALRRGHATQACENSRLLRWLARRQGVDSRPFDLASEPPARLDGPFDLVYCFEVAEHVAPDFSDRLVAMIANQAQVAVFTAAHPGQGGTGHVNEQPRKYWIERFKRAGMRYRPDLSASAAEGFQGDFRASEWLVPNVMVFERPRRQSG
jgi:SAM-dependent methyltransferase